MKSKKLFFKLLTKFLLATSCVSCLNCYVSAMECKAKIIFEFLKDKKDSLLGLFEANGGSKMESMSDSTVELLSINLLRLANKDFIDSSLQDSGSCCVNYKKFADELIMFIKSNYNRYIKICPSFCVDYAVDIIDKENYNYILKYIVEEYIRNTNFYIESTYTGICIRKL